MRLTHDSLAQMLLDAVRAQQLERTEDRLQGGAPARRMPNLDLAVVAFVPGGAPVWANVLFSREHPQGVVADIGTDGGPVRNIRFVGDLRDAAGRSVAWLPEADWLRLRFAPLWGDGPLRFIAPYPASLAKLMFAVGVARCVDQQRCDWEEPWPYEGQTHSVAHWFEDMISTSSNLAASALVALLHRCGALGRAHNALHAAFELYGLPTLCVDDTRADGGWDNAAGAGVGHLQMTAWDSARLLWLIDTEAPRPPWLAPGLPPPLTQASAVRLREALDNQALHDVLSSTALAGEPGWVAGLPAREPTRWIGIDGGVRAGDRVFAADVRPASHAASLSFAHKTGWSENYVADAGIVRGHGARRHTHYIVALLSTLGTRYAGGGACITTWRLAALGRTIDAALAPAFAGVQA